MRRRETPAELGNNDEIRPAASGALIKPLQPTHRDLRAVNHRAFLLRTLYFATPQAANARFLMNFVTNRSENDNAFFVSAASAPCPILSPFFWLQGGRARPHLHRAPSCRLSSGDRVGNHNPHRVPYPRGVLVQLTNPPCPILSSAAADFFAARVESHNPRRSVSGPSVQRTQTQPAGLITSPTAAAPSPP
jgi:hypothetical protein